MYAGPLPLNLFIKMMDIEPDSSDESVVLFVCFFIYIANLTNVDCEMFREVIERTSSNVDFLAIFLSLIK